MDTVRLDRFGRVLVPKRLRDRLGLAPGDELLLEIQDGHLVMEPVTGTPRLVRKGKILLVSGGRMIEDPTAWLERVREERIQELIRRTYATDQDTA